MAFMYGITSLAAILAGIAFVIMMMASRGAPQEAAAGAIAMTIALLPYILTRAMHMERQAKHDQAQRDSMLELAHEVRRLRELAEADAKARVAAPLASREA